MNKQRILFEIIAACGALTAVLLLKKIHLYIYFWEFNVLVLLTIVFSIIGDLNSRQLALSLRNLGRGLKLSVIWTIIVFPLYVCFFYIYYTVIGEYSFSVKLPTEIKIIREISTQVVLIAFPEELFFRGYLMNRFSMLLGLEDKLGNKSEAGFFKRLLPNLFAALFFAITHIIYHGNIVHAAVFFPALLFGYLREKTDSIFYPVAMHAACNLLYFFLRGCVGM
ncbi:MAG: JDVT-CTERM system glutamic-type intramembrane protease [Planctomycetota bacterium]